MNFCIEAVDSTFLTNRFLATYVREVAIEGINKPRKGYIVRVDPNLPRDFLAWVVRACPPFSDAEPGCEAFALLDDASPIRSHFVMKDGLWISVHGENIAERIILGQDQESCIDISMSLFYKHPDSLGDTIWPTWNCDKPLDESGVWLYAAKVYVFGADSNFTGNTAKKEGGVKNVSG